jgi:hypothetical protein
VEGLAGFCLGVCVRVRRGRKGTQKRTSSREISMDSLGRRVEWTELGVPSVARTVMDGLDLALL